MDTNSVVDDAVLFDIKGTVSTELKFDGVSLLSSELGKTNSDGKFLSIGSS